MARDDRVAPLLCDRFQAAYRLDGVLGPAVDETADGDLALDVLGKVGGVKRKDVATAANGLVNVDQEALMAGRVPGGGQCN
jgi:hypothetical protein